MGWQVCRLTGQRIAFNPEHDTCLCKTDEQCCLKPSVYEQLKELQSPGTHTSSAGQVRTAS